LAVTGLVIWIIYVLTDTEALAWVALVLLLVVATLGLTMVTRWRQERAAVATGSTGSTAGAERPAEQHFPVAVVYLHGLLAVITLVLVLLTALGVGGS
jgi:flagellar basal body-associated protein FliL